MNALVVDDQPSTLMLIRAILDHVGYHVVECSNGQSAIDALLTDHFDLVILDLNLPDISGVDLLRSPRLMHSHLPPVLGMTASPTPELVEKAAWAGMYRVLPKPISREQLIDAAADAVKAGRSTELAVVGGAAIDPAILAEVHAINGPRVYRFVHQALVDAGHCLEDLRLAVEDADLAAWRRHAQTLDGVALTLGARRLTTAIADVSALSDEQLTSNANSFTTHFSKLADEAQQALNECLWYSANGVVDELVELEKTEQLTCVLSDRERAILRWTGAGKTSHEIGIILGLSTRTVNFCVTGILDKLQAVNKTHAVVKAVVLDLLN
ncbi:MAG: response regulator [Rudaea sp.]